MKKKIISMVMCLRENAIVRYKSGNNLFHGFRALPSHVLFKEKIATCVKIIPKLFLFSSCLLLLMSIVNFPLLSGDVPRLPSYGIYISQLVRFAICCTSVLDFHSKNIQIA